MPSTVLSADVLLFACVPKCSDKFQSLHTLPHSINLLLAFSPCDGVHIEAHALQTCVKPFDILCTLPTLAGKALDNFILQPVTRQWNAAVASRAGCIRSERTAAVPFYSLNIVLWQPNASVAPAAEWPHAQLPV